MDLDLAKALEKLEIRKRTIEQEADLSSECQSILELDNRIGTLLNETKALASSLQPDFSLVQEACDVLRDKYDKLKETSELFEMVSHLMKLDKICKQIDTVSCVTKDACNGTVTSSQEDQDKEKPNVATFASNRIFEHLIKEFNELYQPVEATLTTRPDLPYRLYAKKVADFEHELENVTRSKKSDGT